MFVILKQAKRSFCKTASNNSVHKFPQSYQFIPSEEMYSANKMQRRSRQGYEGTVPVLYGACII